MLIKSLKTSLARLCAGLALAASGSAFAADPGISDTAITLGMSAPFSGPNDAYGKEMKEGALAYFSQLNASGGINGRRVELVTLDDGYETDRTVAPLVSATLSECRPLASSPTPRNRDTEKRSGATGGPPSPPRGPSADDGMMCAK